MSLTESDKNEYFSYVELENNNWRLKTGAPKWVEDLFNYFVKGE